MYKAYQVKMQDTLDSIANDFNTTVENIMALNELKNISFGDYIVVPVNNDWYKYYIVKKGDNIYNIASLNNTSASDVLMINGLNKDDYIYPGQEIMLPKENVNIYVTKKNETLGDIADKMNISISDILEQNKNIYVLEDQLIIYKK